MSTISTHIQSRGDTEENWKLKDPILLKNEVAYTINEPNLNKYKIGDGKSKWSALPYAIDNYLSKKTNHYEWIANIKCSTWSRLCYVECKTKVTGSAFILSVSATRGNVVYNDTFMIKTHHNKNSLITKLSGSKYGSSVKYRVVSDGDGNCFVEILDSAKNATNTTSQSIQCVFTDIAAGIITPYTSFTDGTTISSSFGESSRITTNSNSLQGNLTWGEITGKPSSYPASSHNHDDRYYTESEMDAQIQNLISTITSLSNRIKALEGTNVITISTFLNNNKIGFGLGNSFTNPLGETNAYGTVNQDMINKIANAGFKYIRVMFDFGKNHWSSYNDWAFPDYFVKNNGTEKTDMKFVISTEWLARIKEVFNYCKNAGLIMILCPMNWIVPKDTSICYGSSGAIHFAAPNNTMKNYVTLYLKNLWTQLATYFKDESNSSLLFETINEPLNRYSSQCGSLYTWQSDDWYGLSGSYQSKTVNAEASTCLKQYNITTINTVHAISPSRIICCPTYAHNTVGVWINDVWNSIKDYNNVCVAMHWYEPQAICGANVESGATFKESDLTGDNTTFPYMNRMITALKEAQAKSIPMIFTEGSIIADTRVSTTEQKKWATWIHNNITNTCKIPFTLFDNGVYKNGTSAVAGKGEDYGFLDRTKYTWRNSDLINTLTNN